jgi:hypothetical protein
MVPVAGLMARQVMGMSLEGTPMDGFSVPKAAGRVYVQQKRVNCECTDYQL